MKTLDEVIKALSIPAVNGYHYIDSNDAIDALKYLKMYKELANDSALFAKWKENPPLTWDELRTMEGKPIWVMYSGYTPNWEIVENTGHFVETNMSILHKEDQGKTWQAYRKERE